MVLENQAKIVSVVVIHTSQLDLVVVIENQAKLVFCSCSPYFETEIRSGCRKSRKAR